MKNERMKGKKEEQKDKCCVYKPGAVYCHPRPTRWLLKNTLNFYGKKRKKVFFKMKPHVMYIYDSSLYNNSTSCKILL